MHWILLRDTGITLRVFLNPTCASPTSIELRCTGSRPHTSASNIEAMSTRTAAGSGTKQSHCESILIHLAMRQ